MNSIKISFSLKYYWQTNSGNSRMITNTDKYWQMMAKAGESLYQQYRQYRQIMAILANIGNSGVICVHISINVEHGCLMKKSLWRGLQWSSQELTRYNWLRNPAGSRTAHLTNATVCAHLACVHNEVILETEQQRLRWFVQRNPTGGFRTRHILLWARGY